jgi:hypothetical protein
MASPHAFNDSTAVSQARQGGQQPAFLAQTQGNLSNPAGQAQRGRHPWQGSGWAHQKLDTPFNDHADPASAWRLKCAGQSSVALLYPTGRVDFVIQYYRHAMADKSVVAGNCDRCQQIRRAIGARGLWPSHCSSHYHGPAAIGQ